MENNKDIITSQAVRQVLSEYTGQYKRYPGYALTSFIAPALGTILIFFIPPLIIGKLVTDLSSSGSISLGFVWPYIFLFGGSWLLGEILWRIGLHYLIKIEALGMNTLGQTAFQRLADRDYDFYTNHFIGSLTKKALAFSKNFENFTDTLSFNVANNILPIIFALVVLARFSVWLPIILIFWICFAIAVALPLVRRRSRLVAMRHDASSKVSGRLSDILANVLVIKSFAQEENEADSFKEHLSDYSSKFKQAADFQNQRFDTVVAPIYVTANICGLVAAIFFTGSLGLGVGTIVVVFSYYAQTTRFFWEINRVYRNFESSVSEAAEFAQMFLEEPPIKDSPRASTLVVSGANLKFSKVNFRYGNEDKATLFLRNFSLDIKSRQKIGLVGPSGGGKTTITKLLLRFVDVESGSIAIDGQDIREVTQTSLRRAVGYVPQEPLLFHRSITENIAYGNEEATEKQIMKAAKLAHADEFIRELPRGYQTLVGERGVKLSGGQRQRVAIARAILKNAPILILDEATSSLDSESEKYIQEGLRELMKNKTALVIAHRLSTIKHLDRIIVLDKGRIVQDGTHDELIKQKGIYAKLWEHQSGGFLED